MITLDEALRNSIAGVRPALAFGPEAEQDPAAWQRRLRARLCRHLRIQPAPGAEPAVEELEREPADGYTRRRIHLEAHDGVALPCYVLVPDGLEGRGPACIALHGHGPGKIIPVGIARNDHDRDLIAGERDYAVQAVRRGMIAIAPDMRGFGELMLEEDRDAEGRNGCYTLAARLVHSGGTLLGQRVLDVMRCVDYLRARPDVDPDRIVATGNSGGGTATLFASAVDTRIAAAAPSCHLCTFRASILSIHHCICNFVPGLLETAEMADVGGLIAPRPLLVIAGEEDPIFPIAGVREAFAALRPIYRAFEAEDRLELFVGPGGHRYYADRVWDFFEQQLAAAGS
jgi:dienelactone hydrolase